MAKATLISSAFVPCLGCGNKVWLIFKPAVIMISSPDITCSEECLARYIVSTKSFLEKQVRDAN